MKLMQRTAAVLVLAGLAIGGQARLNEHQKENFFDFMMSSLDGRDFLSTVANRVMERT